VQLPQRTVDALALRQQLLAQHEGLQARLQGLTQAAADDVRFSATSFSAIFLTLFFLYNFITKSDSLLKPHSSHFDSG
jgi:hypothetical protein